MSTLTMHPAPLIIPPAPVELPEGANFMYALMKAIAKDQKTMSEQQLVDAKSTMIAVHIERALYHFWQHALTIDADAVRDAKSQEAAEKAQTAYSLANSKAQAAEGKADGAVQSTQGQTQADATNLQIKAQYVVGAITILTMLSNMLGNITA